MRTDVYNSINQYIFNQADGSLLPTRTKILSVACKLRMTVPAIYMSLYLLTVILCFVERDWTVKYKRISINGHFILLLLLLVDIFIVNLRGVWLDRLIVVAFLLTASAIFALYRKTLRLWQKIYFGFFLFYPAIAAVTLLMDRIMFVVVASPLLVSLAMPETRFSDKDYEIRAQVGLLAPMRLQLIKKGLITEKVLGTCADQDVVNLDITSLNIKNQRQDTTTAIINSKNKMFEVTFTK